MEESNCTVDKYESARISYISMTVSKSPVCDTSLIEEHQLKLNY